VTVLAAVPVSIPSPTQGVWQLGPLPLRAYALCILAGIVLAIWLTDRRWRARGGSPGTVGDIAAWAVPFGIIGGRLYHVATSWQPYFGPGGRPVEALYIWQGGLGIWGAVALGGVGAWIGARRAGVRLPVFADAAAPGIVLAQAVGRLGNWFNNELYGSPTTLPWGLTIHEWDSAAGRAVLGADGRPVVLGTFHPTFLYELLWNVGIAAVLLWLDRRHRLGHGRLFAVYVLLYTVGRFWIEALRVDPANQILGLRLNLWTSVLVGLGALVYLVVSARLRPGREESVLRPSAVPAPPVPVAERLGGGRPEAHEGDEGDEPGGADGTGTEADAGGPGDGAADGAAGGEKVAGRRGDPPGAEVPRP
jgi:prolipoprotein diacylglyceryl transferase